MVIRKQKMTIRLEEDVEKLKNEIEELKKVKNILMNSPQYKLLYGKTQVIGNEQSKIRARIQHSVNISSIAKHILEGIYEECASDEQKSTLIFQLNKQKEMLYVEICSFAHDLGHTPFGHNGEKSFNQFMQNINNKKEIDEILEKRIKCFGREYEEQQGHVGEYVVLSFEHNEQSALMIDKIIKNSEINQDIVNVPRIISAILSHSTTRVTKCPEDLIAQIIRHSDKIEYRIMDFEEVRKYIKAEKYKNKELMLKTPREKIMKIINDVVNEAMEKGRIDDNMVALEPLRLFRKEYEDAIYFLDNGRKGLLTSENIERNRVIVLKILEYYYDNPDKINYTKYLYPISQLNTDVQKKVYSVYNNLENKELTKIEIVINYVLSMDNRKIEKEYLKLVKQRILTGKGIEPVLPEELEQIRIEQEEEKIEQLRAKAFVRTAQPRAKQEIRNIIRAKDSKFMNEMLTEEGMQTIQNTRNKIEEERKIDRILYEQMELADLLRRYNKKIENIGEIDKIIGKPRVSEHEQRRNVAMNVKEGWIYVEGANKNEELNEGEERY